ncbi:MAG: ADP-ribosylglycohydrolase family protein [Candidatus Eisenbacteria bacterium]|uniref:ADP-ribosylglycohydrolase family protein n=1 Tax=Eiseniibacteriota bacterium TaxID=2212470 RepID=A0A938BR03_UNCEI|nr:ADP-ribosylglycohydrolase family protein [Candidatus Eisenbacteria bacterium]
MELRERFRGTLLGLAVGDAVGASVEFLPRGTFAPLTDMSGGGPFRLAAGQWTDDTSMALCLAESLLERKGFDARDQMERYCRWQETGYWSSTGACFGIGGTVAAALREYRRSGRPFAGSDDPLAAGNGSLMRLAPLPMFYFPDADAVEARAADSSRTTHAAAECVDACRLFGRILCRALMGMPKEEVAYGDRSSFSGAGRIVEIARGAYAGKDASAVRGSGYVVESLEAAMWCFMSTDGFEAAILRAANLGDDADTTAAVCGQIAGACYGRPGIPARWLERLARRSEITDLADRLHVAAGSANRSRPP